MPEDVALSQPLYDAGIGQAVSRFWRKYAVFSGRAGRAEYWWWVLVSGVVALVLEGVRFALLGGSFETYVATPTFALDASSIPTLAWFAATFVPGQALGVRRLHDAGRTGWWQLLSIAVTVVLLVQSRLAPPRLPEPGQVPAPALGTVITSGVVLVVSVVLIVLYTSPPAASGRRFDHP